MINGLIDLPWWGYIVVALAFTHITIAGVTIFLHRCQAHRALDLHPIPSHFFRFWLWLTTGMVTKQWAAIHRKHHAKCETPDDPHSPQVLGINKVMWEGAELYRAESKNAETMEKFGKGTPDDWLERNVYTKHSAKGIALMFLINVILFGPIGITIWAVQMLWIPFFAAGIINGVGHYWGYRNFECADASTNIIPWGIIIGGEELHNNHHTYASSAKLSNKWYEFDIGWMYIRIMEMLGLAHVKKVAPKAKLQAARTDVDAETLHAVITHRYEIMASYVKSLGNTMNDEFQHLKERTSHANLKTFKQWLHLDATALEDQDKKQLGEVLDKSKVLATIYSMGRELPALWERSTASQEQLLKQLQDWCHRAEASGIESLQNFARSLRCYA